MFSASLGSAENLTVRYVFNSSMIRYPHFSKKHAVPALKLNYSSAQLY